MLIDIDCSLCEGGKKPFINGDGNQQPCPYCRGTGKRQARVPHDSHKMSAWHIEVLAPSGTPRFYQVRECEHCGEEEWKHAAGHFLHRLETRCPGK